MAALARDARDVGGNRVEAAEVVEQPAVEPLGPERRLDRGKGRPSHGAGGWPAPACTTRCLVAGHQFSSIAPNRAGIIGRRSPRLTSCSTDGNHHETRHTGRAPAGTRRRRSRRTIRLGPQAAQAPPPDLQTPSFRVQVDYVEVDALVTDEEGRFVRDLTKDDFQVFEDGKPQSISTFTLVDIPVERPDRPLFTETPIEPDVETNERPFDGRIYVMILDDLHVDALRSQLVKIAARRFIERNLGANDLMAVIFTGGRADAAQEFTSNKRLLLASVDRFIGRKLQSATLARNEEYFRQAAGAFQDQRIPDPVRAGARLQRAGHDARRSGRWPSGLRGVRGRRKTMLFVSEGIDYDITDIIRAPDTPMSSASVILDDIREAIQATARSNVSIYGIDPRGLTSIADETIGVTGFAVADDPPQRGIGPGGLMNELQLSQDNLRALSEETNGFAVVNRNDPGPSFDRIVRDNSSYYVLAYYPPTDKKDGKFHRIEVRVNRPGLTVRARRGYLAPEGQQQAGAAAKPTAARRRPPSKR